MTDLSDTLKSLSSIKPIQLSLDYLDLDHLYFIMWDPNSPIEWSNQTGGTACFYPQIRGTLIPLPPSWIHYSGDDPLIDYCGAYYASRVQEFLSGRSQQLQDMFEPIPDDELAEYFPVGVDLAEAWVPVRVRAELPEGTDTRFGIRGTFGGLEGRVGVLTYLNSD